MRIYGGKHLGGGFGIGISTRIGSSSGGYRSYPKNNSSDVGGYLGITVAIIIGALTFALTQRFILSLVFAIVAAIIVEIIKSDLKRKTQKKIKVDIEVSKISQQIQKYIDLIKNGKTLSTRENNCTKAIVLLKKLKRLQLDKNQVLITSDVMETLIVTQRVLPVGDLLLKAEKAEFKGQNKKAIDFYLDILYKFKKGQISDSDFSSIQLMDENTGKIITRNHIKYAAEALGWNAKTTPAIMPNRDKKIMINCPECNSHLPRLNFSIISDRIGICPICDKEVIIE